LQKLHQSQVKAYQEAAIQSVKEWGLALPLQPMEEDDTKISFVNRCIKSVNNVSGANAIPNWKFGGAKITAMQEIRKRAAATFDKYHPPEEEKEIAIAASASCETGTADEAEGESVGGSEAEDGELTADDSDGAASDQEKTTGKKVPQNRKKNRLTGVKKNVAQKKGTKAKAGTRSTRGGRGARRGGRGGRGGK